MGAFYKLVGNERVDRCVGGELLGRYHVLVGYVECRHVQIDGIISSGYRRVARCRGRERTTTKGQYGKKGRIKNKGQKAVKESVREIMAGDLPLQDS